ncbi:MAG: sialate O-acetylesterase [Armatimonadota bacterium]
MMAHRITTLIFILCVLMQVSASVSAEPVDVGSQQNGGNMDLWVLAGQSNMVGAAPMRKPGKATDRIMLFNLDNKWIQAQEPLHRLFEAEAPIFKDLFLGKNIGATVEQYDQYRQMSLKTPLGTVGPGLFFARHLIKYIDNSIGLIPSAYGATSMQDWDPSLKDKGGHSLYGAMIERIALARGSLKGVLWYQGESDAMMNESEYERLFLHFVDCVRRDTGIPDLPFIYVQISRYALDYSPPTQGWETVHEAQRQAALHGKGIYMVSAIDLLLGDSIHLSYEANERLGRRLGEVALSAVYGRKDHGTPIALESIEMLESVNTMGRLRVRYKGVSGALKADGAPTGFTLRSKEPDNGGPSVFRVDLDTEDPSSVIVWYYPSITIPVSLYYAAGLNPYANIVDKKDMAVPAFGPVEILPAGK